MQKSSVLFRGALTGIYRESSQFVVSKFLTTRKCFLSTTINTYATNGHFEISSASLCFGQTFEDLPLAFTNMNFCIAKPVLDYDTLAKGLKLDDNLVDWMVSRVNFWLILVLTSCFALLVQSSVMFSIVLRYTHKYKHS